jgi:tricorn protease
MVPGSRKDMELILILQYRKILSMMAKGKDPQLQKGIEEIKNLLKTKGYKPPARPVLEKKAY